MLAAVIQLCSGPDRSDNLALAEQWMLAAKKRGADLLVLPENFSYFGHTESEKRAAGEDLTSSPSLDFLKRFAVQHQVWIVGGSIPLICVDSNKITNSCFVVDSSGVVRGRYDKIHLFDVNLGGEAPYRESDLVQAGKKPVVVTAPFGTLGLSICYDLRFPELYRTLSLLGATILTVPAAFTQTTGPDHWQVLLRARAIENFCYVLASGQEGRHVGGRRTYGHSMVVDPWGSIIAQCTEGAGFALAELNPQRLERCRQRIPCLQHRVLTSG